MRVIIRRFRELIRKTAQDIDVGIGITEYQLHDAPGQPIVIAGEESRREMGENEVLTIFDPRPRDIAFVANRIRHPLQRGIAVFTDKERMEDLYQILASQQLPDITQPENTRRGLQRIFALYFPLNPDAAADLRDQHATNIGLVLGYPNIKPKLTPQPYDRLFILGSDSRENSAEFRDNFIEEDEPDSQ